MRSITSRSCDHAAHESSSILSSWAKGSHGRSSNCPTLTDGPADHPDRRKCRPVDRRINKTTAPMRHATIDGVQYRILVTLTMNSSVPGTSQAKCGIATKNVRAEPDEQIPRARHENNKHVQNTTVRLKSLRVTLDGNARAIGVLLSAARPRGGPAALGGARCPAVHTETDT